MDKDPYENFNEQLLDCDYESLLSEMRFYQTIRSLSEDLEARLINYLSNLQSKNKKFDTSVALKEIIEIMLNIKSEWTKSMNKSEYLEKLFQQTSVLKSISSGHKNDCVSL